jgi:tRNA-2-methylthio-N6-dimethylallyladenosine synthase
VEITYAAPHHLNADAGITALRRTAGGDAWQARNAGPEKKLIGLGLPSVSRT